MEKFITIAVACLVGFGLIALALKLFNLTKEGLPFTKRRNSPFTGEFLRGPGESLRKHIEEERYDLVSYILSLMMIPIMFALWLPSSITNRALSAGILFIILVLLFIFYKIFNKSKEYRKIMLGYEGEVAVGQELNHLMKEGYYVFHDLPFDGFNIDHVVIGRTGVFVVETKARAKPDTGDGRRDARVKYNGNRLDFPDWKETKPIEQARLNAQSLSKWLSSAVGERMVVQAVVAVPGWFVERTGKSDVSVYNGHQREALSLFLKQGVQKLNDAQVQRIVHQIDKKCRDIEPIALRKKKSKFA